MKSLPSTLLYGTMAHMLKNDLLVLVYNYYCVRFLKRNVVFHTTKLNIRNFVKIKKLGYRNLHHWYQDGIFVSIIVLKFILITLNINLHLQNFSFFEKSRIPVTIQQSFMQ